MVKQTTLHIFSITNDVSTNMYKKMFLCNYTESGRDGTSSRPISNISTCQDYSRAGNQLQTFREFKLINECHFK